MISSRFGCLGLLVLLAPGALWAQDWAKIKPTFLATLPLPQGNEALDQFTRTLQRTPYDDLTRIESELRDLKAEEAKKTSVQRDMVLIQLALEMQGPALEKALVFVEKNPTDLEMALLAGRICRQQSKLELGIKVLEDAIQQPTLKDNPTLKIQIIIELARNLELAGKLVPARARFKEAAELLDLPGALAKSSYTPQGITLQSADIHERLAVLAQKAKEPDTAMNEFLLAAKIDPARRARLGLPLAELLEAKGQHNPALTRINDYLALIPKSAEAFELKAQILEKAGRSAEALAVLEDLHKKDPLHGNNAILFAQKLIQAKRTQEGEAILLAEWKELESRPAADELIKLWGSDKENGPGKLLDAITYALNVPTAQKSYSPNDSTKESDKDPKNKNVKEYEKDILKVMLQAAISDLTLIEGMMKTALARRGTPTEPTPVMMYCLLKFGNTWGCDFHGTMEQLGEVVLSQKGLSPKEKARPLEWYLDALFSQGKCAAVITKGNALLTEIPAENQTEIRFTMARAYAYLGQIDKAMAEVALVTEKAPLTLRHAYDSGRVRIYGLAEQYEQAVAEADKQLKLVKLPEEFHYICPFKAFSLVGLGKNDEAIAIFRDLVAKFPVDTNCLLSSGYHLLNLLEDPSEGERLIQRATEIREQANGNKSSELPNYEQALGWAHFRQGRKDEAARHLRKAASLPGAEYKPFIWAHLGDVESAMGNGEEARKHWKKALDLAEKGVGINEMWYIPSQFKAQLKQKLAQAAGDTGQ
jgi:tetratricopeptide (TPR) repeat protein